jgi:hypothetical protein
VPDQTPAQIAYAAYGASTGGLNYQGLPMPTLHALPGSIQLAWQDAAEAITRAACPAVDIYPVGLLAHLAHWASNPDRREAWRRLFYDVRAHGLSNLRPRRWASLRRWLLNGYLAEPTDWPDGLTRCGTGWTRGRALRDLQRRTDAARQLLGGPS